MDNYLDDLNEQQRAAVEYVDGPSLVIAGAGSGKTRVLTYKIVHLLTLGYTPYRILALTFTNKAAREMKQRISALVGDGLSAQLWMGTFHSIFSRILHINTAKLGFHSNFTIYDAADSKSLIKVIIKDMQLDDKVYKPASIQAHISNMKNALISPEAYAADAELRKADERAQRPLTYKIYSTYWNRCFVAGAMDFDDLLFYTNILFRDNPDVLKKYQDFFQYVLVDEYQDTNFAQHVIVKQLSSANHNLCVVGDDAQSIYSFRGANISNILNLKNHYPELRTFKLERNYRSTQNIIEAANSLIAKNKQQIKKHIFSENAVGSKIAVIQSYSDYEESYVVANHIIALKSQHGDSYDDFAVLYRTNAQSRVLEEALRKRNIPYRIYGGLSFYQRKEIKDAVSYFRLSVNPDDDEALRRVINNPSRGIGETTVGKVRQAAVKHNVSMWTVLCSPDGYDLDVNSGTMHKLMGFKELMTSFIDKNAAGENAYELARVILADSGLIAAVHSDNTPENISRQENLDELINGVNDFISARMEEGSENLAMTDFLGEISLATDQDTDSADGSCVTLMTVHAAKGLEFKNVIIVGVEEDLFPAAMSADSISGIEEERRLLYVAITRAKDNCVLTYATSRFHNGQTKSCTPSRFIMDIDPQYLSLAQTSASAGDNYKRPSYHQPSVAQSFFAEHTRQFNNEPKPKQNSAPIRPAAPSVPSRPSQQSADDFGLHASTELSVGMKIEHSRFGVGEISKIDRSGASAKIVVSFGGVGEKTLLLKFARFKILS